MALSIATSVIQLIDATAKVIKYINDVKDAPKDRARLAREATSLLTLLTDLRYKVEEANPIDPWFTGVLSLGVEGGPLEQFNEALEGLARKLKPEKGIKKFSKIPFWTLDKDEISDTFTKIERLKTLVSLALQNDHLKLSRAIKDDIAEVKSDTRQTARGIAELREGQEDDQREKIHRWLSAPDPSLNYNEALKKRQTGTGEWLIGSKQYADWKTNPDSFLWLHGIPGSGKTILSSTAVEDVLRYCDHNSTLRAVYFYFDFNDIEKQQHEKMICSLITQLSTQCTSTPKALEMLFSSKMNGKQQPTATELLVTLRQMVQGFSETFIILDALDECNEREDLLTAIEEIIGWKTGKLHILATSRRGKDIEEGIKHLVDDKDEICIQSALVNRDISAYVHERLQTDRRLRRWQNEPEAKQEIEEVLMKKAGGMFRWAVCQLDTLVNCLNLSMLRKALASLPKTLDDTYARILKNIEEEHCQNVLKILQWLAYSTRPLQLEELAEVIAIDIEDNPRFDPERRFLEPLDILTICSSLVVVTTERPANRLGITTEEQIRLAHFSVKEYLVSERIRAGPARQYSIQEVPANVSIAEMCLAYLLQFDSPDSLTNQTVEEFPLASYASRYWAQHARVAGKDMTTVQLLIMELFLSRKDAYVNSIRLSDLDDAWELPDIRKSSTSVAPPLYYAALAGLVESTRLLLDKGADVNARGGRYDNALQAALFNGHNKVFQLLLEKGANVNAQGGEYGNALQAASLTGHHQAIQLLLEKGADVNAQGGEYGNALQAASLRGHHQAIQLLLEKGADVNAQGGEYGNALQAASFAGHHQAIQLLLEKGADVNAQGRQYGNALQAASLRGHHQAIQLLLEKGADVNAQGRQYGNALQAASLNGHHQAIQLLLEKGADVNAQGGQYGNALQAASLGGHHQAIQLLLEKGADVNAQGGIYGNALQAASYHGHGAVLRQLLEVGASVNAHDGYLSSDLEMMPDSRIEARLQLMLEGGAQIKAFHRAAESGDEAGVQNSVDSGIDINAKGGLHEYALHAAARRGHVGVIKLLLKQRNSDPDRKDVARRTPLWCAASSGHEVVMRALLDTKKVDVSSRSITGRTPLWWPSSHGYLGAVQLLLGRGADPNLPDNSGATPLSEASKHGHEAVVQLLRSVRQT